MDLTPSLIGRLEVASISLILLSIIIFFVLSLKGIKKPLLTLRKTTLKKLIFIILLLVAIQSVYLIKHKPGIFYDEWTYLAQGKSILEKGENTVCSFGTINECNKSQLNYLVGYPFLISISYLIFGINYFSGVFLSFIMNVLSLVTFFFLVYLIFKDEKIALYSALVYSFVPLLIEYSTIPNNLTTSIFFIIFTLLCFFLYRETGNKYVLLLLISAMAFAINTRAENVVLIPMMILFSIVYKINIFKRLYSWLVLIILSLPSFLHLLFFGYGITLLSKVIVIDTAYIRDYILNIIYKTNIYSSITFTFLAFLGAILMIYYKKYRKDVLTLLIFISLFSSVYFINPQFEGLAPLYRYTIFIYPLLVIFCSLGLKKIMEKVESLEKKQQGSAKKVYNLSKYIILILIFSSFFVFILNFEDKENIDKLLIKDIERFELFIDKKIKTDYVNCYVIVGNMNGFFNLKEVLVAGIDDMENIEESIERGKCMLTLEEKEKNNYILFDIKYKLAEKGFGIVKVEEYKLRENYTIIINKVLI